MTSRNNHRALRATALVCVVGLAMAACGGASDADSPADPAPATASEADANSDAAASSDATPPLLQFSSTLVGGGELDAATLAGKPTAFWFWSPT